MARQPKIYTEAKDLVFPSNPEYFPIIPIDGKMYPVDNRVSVMKQLQNVDMNDSDKIIELTMGKEAAKEIMKMDLTVTSYQNLVILIMAAINEVEFEEMKKQMEEASQSGRFRG